MVLFSKKIKFNNFIYKFRNFSRWHICFGLLLLCLLIFLSIRAKDEYQWSDWGYGDAQTMLSSNQWEKGGWVANRFLFLPQGYSTVIRLLDEPGLRHHAYGICPHSSPKVAPRLWYTHYPSGYLIPYALLYKLVLDNLFFMKMLSIFFSLTALIFMYILFSKITSPAVSFLAVFFYGLSSPFLNYAYSLANQPADDLFRFAFMLAIVLSTRATSLKQRKIFMISAWVIEFLLSLSSYDSVFFVYMWLVGWNLLEYREFRWKTYIIFALAPLTGFFVQFIQSVWYLGVIDTILDFTYTFLVKSRALERGSVFSGAFMKIFNNLCKPAGLFIVMLTLYGLYIKFLRIRKRDTELPSFGLLAVLFLCGLIFVFILSSAALMTYQPRQMVPFVAILASGFTWSFWKEFIHILHKNYNDKRKEERLIRRRAAIVYIILSGIVLFVFWSNFIFSNRKPVFNKTELKNEPDIIFAKKIKSIPTRYEPVFFDIDCFQKFIIPYIPGYPQIHSFIEYYTGSKLILGYTRPAAIVSDLLLMIDRSQYKFSPVLITKDAADIEKVVSILRKEGALKQMPEQPSPIMGRYVLDLTDYLRWELKN